ncbi:Long wavelength sensitive opsin 4 [Ladona fulva]|uniref:Long wavelength sensitive opsin 4 n=2 Tax=Ladona fulva TaxID=123851 RepID=A0A8K0KMI9_LADFU|nr:Long wavelength sensitive opsin 4 [Ladona fulva]
MASAHAMEPQMAAQWANKTVVDMVLPDMLHKIDPHWYQFPPMNPLWHGILGFVIGCLGLISWTGNGVVIYIFSCTKSLRTPSNLLVVNLAFSDFFMMVIMCPFMLINCIHETWVFGPLMCELYAFAGSLFGCASIWTMVTIAFDRYNVIVKKGTMKDLYFYHKIFSPLVTIWGSVFAKANAVYNPIVYGISHPKYRAVLNEKLPFLVCGGAEPAAPADNQSQVSSGTAAEEKA